jgi:hypothetical protein
MHRVLLFLLFVLFSLFQSGALSADSGVALSGPAAIATAAPGLQACPNLPDPSRLNLAQVVQTDCCKGHKGVCGCRAGKIVCCDNTASSTCTCHSDWHEAN